MSYWTFASKLSAWHMKCKFCKSKLRLNKFRKSTSIITCLVGFLSGIIALVSYFIFQAIFIVAIFFVGIYFIHTYLEFRGVKNIMLSLNLDQYERNITKIAAAGTKNTNSISELNALKIIKTIYFLVFFEPFVVKVFSSVT